MYKFEHSATGYIYIASKWIDLIFGYKQQGDEALANHNVFHHFFYEGAVDMDKIDDPMQRNAAMSFIHNFGQMPKQVCRDREGRREREREGGRE